MSSYRPPAAERARTVLAHAATAVVDGGGDVIEPIDLMGVDSDGSLVLLVNLDSPLANRVTEHAIPCRVHAALVSPVPGPDRVLDRVTVFGHCWLAADVTAALQVVVGNRPEQVARHREASVLLRVKVAQLRIDGERVDLDRYARARPDPLAAGSDDFVQHLVRAHAAEVLQLAHLFDPDTAAGIRAFAPIRVDRFGLLFRVDTTTGSQTARLAFAEPLHDADELPMAMTALQRRAARVTSCPFDGQPSRAVPPVR